MSKQLVLKAPFPLNFANTVIPSKLRISPTILNNLINNVTKSKNFNQAIQIHSQLITQGYLPIPFLFNNILNLYSKCGCISQALTLFSTTNSRTVFYPNESVITYTSLITMLSHSKFSVKAMDFFNEMRRNGIFPNHFTFSAVLPACADTMVIFHGQQMHSLICQYGFDSDVFVGSALVDMYAKCGEMGFARILFDEMPERNLVSWNSMIVGFLQNKLFHYAIELFARVFAEDNINPDQVSFSSVLSACANVQDVNIGKQVHGVVIKRGLEYLPYVKNSLMDMYSKCGVFNDAGNLFTTIDDRDVVTWNVMMMGCVQNNNFEEACNYFWMMRQANVLPDEASFSTVLHSASCIAAMDQGSLIHDQIIKAGFEKNACISSSLITMYSKCGSLSDARQVFTESEDHHNVVIWTAMISACQQHGCADQVIELFNHMLRDGVKPDYITFVSVLSACAHTGHVDEGFVYFSSMTRTHGITPGLEHYACMVDLLGRAGKLHKAKEFVETMPVEPDISIWGALLGACRKYGSLETGREVAMKLFEIEPMNPGNYVLLCNMYARAGRLEEADEVRRLMGVNNVRKEPGCSWLDVKNTTFVFTSHDKSHPRTNEIYKMLGELEEMVKKKGYAAEVQYAVNNVDEYKERSLWYHSEKLALAYGLLVLPEGAPIRIKKNLRTCGDCHTVMKFASEIFGREIIVRDVNRFHRFVNGLCSCNDYW